MGGVPGVWFQASFTFQRHSIQPVTEKILHSSGLMLDSNLKEGVPCLKELTACQGVGRTRPCSTHGILELSSNGCTELWLSMQGGTQERGDSQETRSWKMRYR